MVTKKYNSTKIAMLYALFIASLLAVLNSIFYFSNLFFSSYAENSLLIFLVLSIIYFGFRYRNKYLEGTISYSAAFKFGFKTSLNTSFLYGLYIYIVFALDSSLYRDKMLTIQSQLTDMGFSGIRLENKMDSINNFMNPSTLWLQQIIYLSIIGTIAAFISSIIIKNNT